LRLLENPKSKPVLQKGQGALFILMTRGCPLTCGTTSEKS
jgi:hypothetical protein